MKIVGLTYYFGEQEMVLKCDSCLLNGRKPMFVPDSTKDLRFLPVVIARISRLGKNIEARFADRYYDAIAPGADFVAYDRLSEARKEGKSWTQATGRMAGCHRRSDQQGFGDDDYPARRPHLSGYRENTSLRSKRRYHPC